jgi:hypothetical protein
MPNVKATAFVHFSMFIVFTLLVRRNTDPSPRSGPLTG